MSFFSFKPKPTKSHPFEVAAEEPLRNVENIQEFAEDESRSPSESSSLPAGISLINPNLQPEKARNFLDIRLPQSFTVRFLGVHPATGIWGIKHTRKPVDNLVALAKTTDPDDLSLLELEVTEPGVYLRQLSTVRPSETAKEIELGKKPIERISYGVQDVMYPRVFAMISIKEKSVIDDRPFDCYVFLCESRIQSRKLAYCLAKAFKVYGENIKAANYMQTLEADGKKGSGNSAHRSKQINGSVESDA